MMGGLVYFEKPGPCDHRVLQADNDSYAEGSRGGAFCVRCWEVVPWVKVASEYEQKDHAP